MTGVVLSGHRRPPLLAIVALFSVVVAFSAPVVALGQSGQIRLVLRPVGQTRSFFDLTMLPGETRRLQVDIGNAGDAPVVARTYAADVYTIINGGFGARLRDEPSTGTTQWLDYATDVMDLSVGVSVRRAFAVAVPLDVGPGEYITSLVLENDQPLHEAGTVAVKQFVRQAVAVVVTVSGQRSPGVAIGSAGQKVVAGISVVSVAVANTGNVRLKPVVTFALRDPGGTQISHATVAMDTFYARTQTFIEVPLSASLLPGRYSVGITLEDAAQGAVAHEEALPLVVAALLDSARAGGVVPGSTDAGQAARDAQIPFAVSVLIIVGTLAGLASLWLNRRGQRGNSPATSARR